MKLTPPQLETLQFISERYEATLSEIATVYDGSSITAHLNTLERNGYIESTGKKKHYSLTKIGEDAIE